MTEMALAPPIAFSPDLETVGADEEALNQAFIETFRSIVQTVFIDSAHAHRAVHAKSHALLRGMLAVHSDLPPELAQGVFRAPHRYEAVVRISSIAGDILNDNVSLPRGFAIKLFGVEGDRLPGAGTADTQDFIFASGTVFPTADLHAFLKSLKVVAKTTDKAEWAKSALSAVLRPLARIEEKLGVHTDSVKAIGGYPETNPLGERYGSQAAYRFGDYVAKFDIVPASEAFLALEGREFALEGRENAIREEIGAVLAHEGGAWTLRAQLRRDAAANPVEDASVPWPEETNPYLPIATLTVKSQTAWSPDRSSRVDDAMAFSPWHGVLAHQPLGVVGRARRTIYPALSAYRGDLSGCPIREPSAAPDLADA